MTAEQDAVRGIAQVRVEAMDLDRLADEVHDPAALGRVLLAGEKAYTDLAAVLDKLRTNAYHALEEAGLERVEVEGAPAPLKRSFTGDKMVCDWDALSSALGARVADECTFHPETGERMEPPPPPAIIAQQVVSEFMAVAPLTGSVRPRVTALDQRQIPRKRYTTREGGRPTVRWDL